MLRFILARRCAMGRARAALHLLIVLTTLCSMVVFSACGNPVRETVGAPITVNAPDTVVEPTLTSVVASPEATILPSLQPTSTDSPESVEPEQSPVPTNTPASESLPITTEDWDLIFLLDSTLYRGGYWGNDAEPVADIGMPASAAIFDSWLAYDNVDAIGTLDLARLSSQRLIPLPADPTSDISFLWASDGRAIIYLLTVDDSEAPTFERSVEVGRVQASTGESSQLFTLVDQAGGVVLSYDGPREEFLLVPRGGDPSFVEAVLYDAVTGELKTSLDITGDGEVLASPDGRFVLTTNFDGSTERSEVRIYDLIEEGVATSRSFFYEPNTHGVGYVWSPDSSQVAFSLREGISYGYELGEGLGIWVLDSLSMTAHRVSNEVIANSTPIMWTPGTSWIICYHDDSEGNGYYYALSADDGEIHLLPINPQARLVGWVHAKTGKDESDDPEERVVTLLAGAISDAVLLPEAIGAYLELPTVTTLDDTQAALQLHAMFREAGWNLDQTSSPVSITSLGDGYSLVVLPSREIYIFWSGGWQRVAEGDVVQDARLVGDELGLIFAQLQGGMFIPAFLLLSQRPEGGWDVLWSPVGQRDWISTDGSITFLGDGLEGLELVGSSFGLDAGQDQVFAECRACPHRTIKGLWERRGNEYVRLSALPSDASRAESIWEMTESSPYATLYEFVRRIRVGQANEALLLVAGDAALDQALSLGLEDAGLRLMAEDERDGYVHFSVSESGQELAATLEQENGQWKLVRIDEMP